MKSDRENFNYNEFNENNVINVKTNEYYDNKFSSESIRIKPVDNSTVQNILRNPSAATFLNSKNN